MTVCVKPRRAWLGDIVAGEARLSPVGLIVAGEWQRPPQVRPYGVLDAWVVMPDRLYR